MWQAEPTVHRMPRVSINETPAPVTGQEKEQS